MAGVALERRFSMCVAQFEFGFVVIEATLGSFPIALAVAISTLLAQVAGVLVVFFMTGIAFLGCFFEEHALVTVFAVCFGVLAEQGKAGGVVVKLGNLFPVALGMATAAVFAQSLFVLVVFLVAGVAIWAELDAVKMAGVAVGAASAAVFAFECVFGVGVVVEAGQLPLLGAVAAVALLTKLAFVTLLVIVFFMAADARARCFFVVAGPVAIGAFRVDVLAR